MYYLRMAVAATMVVGWTLPGWAQTVGGTIRGTIRDANSAIVPGADVTVTNEGTSLARTAISSSAGEYVVPELQIGTYTVQVSLQGFKTAVTRGIELNIAEVAVVNVTLEVGQLNEEVTVVSEVPIVNTTTGDVSNLIDGTQVRELPLSGRSFVQLTQLMPGVSPPDEFNASGKGLASSGSSRISISGGSSVGNMWLVDGMNNIDVGSNGTLLVFPSIDAIEEFKIHRNSYGPEFGQAAGGTINIVTRSGTNQFRGSGYYFGRNDALAAKDYFLQRTDQPKQELARHDVGYTLGGPILRDRLFFFWSQEWNLEDRGVVRTGLVPTAAEKRGDFSASCGTIPVDPSTRQPFAGNRIPDNRLSRAGSLYLQLFPDANVSGCASPNWVQTTTTPIDWREESLRADVKLNPRTNLMLRFTNDSWVNDSPNAGSYLGLWGDDPFPALDSRWDQPSRLVVAKLSQSIGSSAVNEFQFSYAANRITIESVGESADLKQQINAAMPTVFPESGKAAGPDRAHPLFWGSQGYGPLWTLAPWENSQDLFTWRDDFTKVAGSHTWKAGVLLSFNQKDELVNGGDFFEVPQVSGPTPGTGNILADFLLRDSVFGFTENSVEPRGRGRWRDYEIYAGDSWQLRPNLTLNYGFRWSWLRNPYTADDNIASFDPNSFDPALGADSCNGLLLPPGSTACRDAGFLGGRDGPNRALMENRSNLIVPRIGLAWDPTGEGKTVLRGGFGKFFARERVIETINLAGNPPFVANRSGDRFLDSLEQPAVCAPNCFGPASFGSPSQGIDPNAKPPSTWHFNFTVERELWPNNKVEVAYVGSRGNNLISRKDANQVLPGDNDRDGTDDRLEFARNQGNTSALRALRPFGVFGNTNIFVSGRDSESTYDSLQMMYTTRFGRGSRASASYTWSKLEGLDGLKGAFSTDQTSPFLDNTNLELDRGRALVDRPHIFTANLIYLLPSFSDRGALMRALAGDWEIASIVTYASGPSLTVTNGSAEDLSGTGYAANQRPIRVDGQPCRADGSDPIQWLNPAAYTVTGLGLGTFGNTRRGDCSGPGLKNWDLAFYKNIGTPYGGGRLRVQLRLEIFNFFNTTQFRNVDTVLGPSNLRFDTGNRLTANTVTGSTPSPTFGQAQATRGAREVQYAIRFMW